MAFPDSFAITLKPSNKPIVQGCPGIPQTYPIINGTLQITSGNGSRCALDQIKISFITVDTLKYKPKKDIPSSLQTVNYETLFAINDSVVTVDLPFIISIKDDICATSESLKFGKVNHYLQVVATSNNVMRVFEFPVMITTFDTLPLYRQFNQPISRCCDSKDRLLIMEYSLPSTAIGPQEELVINTRISVVPNMMKQKLIDKIKLKKVQIELVEIFDCRCDKSFIKEQLLLNEVHEFQDEFVGLNSLNQQFHIKLDLEDKYSVFTKHQNEELLYENNENSNYNYESNDKPNNLKPEIIDHNDYSPVPLTHFQPLTRRSKFFSFYYELRIKCKFSNVKDIEIVQPIIISPYNRNQSRKLIQWIRKEQELANEFIINFENQFGKIKFDEKFKCLNFPQKSFAVIKNETVV